RPRLALELQGNCRDSVLRASRAYRRAVYLAISHEAREPLSHPSNEQQYGMVCRRSSSVRLLQGVVRLQRCLCANRMRMRQRSRTDAEHAALPHAESWETLA